MQSILKRRFAPIWWIGNWGVKSILRRTWTCPKIFRPKSKPTFRSNYVPVAVIFGFLKNDSSLILILSSWSSPLTRCANTNWLLLATKFEILLNRNILKRKNLKKTKKFWWTEFLDAEIILRHNGLFGIFFRPIFGCIVVKLPIRQINRTNCTNQRMVWVRVRQQTSDAHQQRGYRYGRNPAILLK